MAGVSSSGMAISPEVSKQVGWEYRVAKYPTLEEVKNIRKVTDIQLVTWYRFLPSPTNEIEMKAIKTIIEEIKRR